MRIVSKAPSSATSAAKKVGHTHRCPTCRTFRVHTFTIVGNGVPKILQKCTECGSEETYTFAAGGWIPQPMLETLDAFVKSKSTTILHALDQAVMEEEFRNTPEPSGPLAFGKWAREHSRIKPAEKVTDDSSRSEQDSYTASPAWQRVRRVATVEDSVAKIDEQEAAIDAEPAAPKRKPRLSRCTKFLLLAVIPGMAAFGMMLVAMVACTYFHYYFDFLRPFWQPWPNDTVKYSGGIVIPAVLMGLYVKCRSASREKKDEVHVESEHETLRGIDEL